MVRGRVAAELLADQRYRQYSRMPSRTPAFIRARVRRPPTRVAASPVGTSGHRAGAGEHGGVFGDADGHLAWDLLHHAIATARGGAPRRTGPCVIPADLIRRDRSWPPAESICTT